MSQEVTNEELEAYWAEVAHAVDYDVTGVKRDDWARQARLDWIIQDWQSELDSRGHNTDTL